MAFALLTFGPNVIFWVPSSATPPHRDHLFKPASAPGLHYAIALLPLPPFSLPRMTKASGKCAKIACVRCSEKKMGCSQNAHDESCSKCSKANVVCEWPDSDAQVSGGPQHKTACNECRKDKKRCRPFKDEEDRTCMNCRGKGVSCFYTAAGTQANEEQVVQALPAQPIAGPSNYPGALVVDNGLVESVEQVVLDDSHRPALTVVPAAMVDGTTSASASPTTRTNSPSRGDWRQVCLAPSPEAETSDEALYEAYSNL